MDKIHIFGSVGSGKTTLARRLSASLSIPMHELDTVVWERHEGRDIRRTTEQRDALLGQIIGTDQWIIEGAQYGWVDSSFRRADLILVLDIPYRLRIYQIISRYVRQKLGLEQAHYKPSFAMLRKMIGWNAGYERNKPVLFEMLAPYGGKVVVIRSRKALREFVEHHQRN